MENVEDCHRLCVVGLRNISMWTIGPAYIGPFLMDVHSFLLAIIVAGEGSAGSPPTSDPPPHSSTPPSKQSFGVMLAGTTGGLLVRLGQKKPHGVRT